MSYNGSGTFAINTSGQPVVTGTVISSSAFNALTADLATGLSTAITKDGQTATTVRIPFAQGINSSLTTDTTSGSTGSIFTAGGVGIAKALFVGTNATVVGTLGVTGAATFSATPIFSALTASSAVATDASKNLVSVTNTGTGNNVLATSPTLVTPVLGAASATSVTVDAGAVGTPSITTTGDTNTGIFFPAADTIAFAEGGAEAMRIDSSGNVGIGTTSPGSKLHVVSSSGENKIISEATAASQQASISLVVQAATPGQTVIYMGKTGATTNGQVGYDPNTNAMYFYTSNSERMRIDSGGAVFINATSAGSFSAAARLSVLGVDGEFASVIRAPTTSTYNVISLDNPNGQVGRIQTSGSAALFLTTSDYRLKEDVAPMTGALAKVAALKPVTYKWKVNGTAGQGFIAHELQEVVPDCVDGDKDAFQTVEVKDENGNVTGTEVRPVYQGVDTSFLVATLTAAIQEQQALITSLTERIVALEAK